MDRDAAAPDGLLMLSLRWPWSAAADPQTDDQKMPGMELRHGADCNHA